MDQASQPEASAEAVCVEGLDLGYGERVILKDLNFCIHSGEIVTILGGSGCGKSTLLKGIIGLLPPMRGSISLKGRRLSGAGSGEALRWARQKMGVLFQSGALIGSLTVAENIALPIEEFSGLSRELIDDIVELKLEQVNLGGYGHLMPSDLSGGMRKRAGLARAMALDPEILFCDEPSAGLDPITSAELDQLLIELNRALHITVVVITHELASIEAISQRSIMLDKSVQGILAIGSPQELKESNPDPRVQAFFRRKPGIEEG